MRTCRDCQQVKEVSSFSKAKGNKDGISNSCKSCRSAHNKAMRIKDPEKFKKRSADYYKKNRNKVIARTRNYAILNKYGITSEQYDQMLQDQGGVCAVCQKDQSYRERTNLYVDHYHQSGEIRGLLCQKCNTGIGMLGDDLDSLLKAVSYLEKANGKLRQC